RSDTGRLIRRRFAPPRERCREIGDPLLNHGYFVILGAAIRRLREDRGWTQDELASRAGMNASYLGLVERRENVPTLTVIVLLAETRCGRRRLGETSRKMMLLLASLPVRLTF